MSNDTPDGDKRLYGKPGDENLHFDFEPVLEDIQDRWDGVAAGPWEIEEWSVRSVRSHLTPAANVIEHIAEMCNEGDEGLYDDLIEGCNLPDVVAAFDAALDLFASKIGYRMADKVLRVIPVEIKDGRWLCDGVDSGAVET